MSMSDLILKQATSDGGMTVVFCEGVLDAHTSIKLDERIEGLIAKGVSRIAVDIQGVTYMASAGVGVFLGSVNTLRERGGDLVVIYPRHVDAIEGKTGISEGYNVLEVFNLLGLADAIPVVRSIADAEAHSSS
jgi:anti-sigma B factor antagonist